MQEIFNRRSIRKFEDKPVEKEKIDKLLRAAMQAPSAANQRPWDFVVVEDLATLKMLSLATPCALPAAGAAVALVLLADLGALAIPTAWQQDMGAAAQNILLEAAHLGLGAVWLGVATADTAVAYVKELFGLPEQLKPFATIAVGYPAGGKNEFVDRYDPKKVHYERY